RRGALAEFGLRRSNRGSRHDVLVRPTRRATIAQDILLFGIKAVAAGLLVIVAAWTAERVGPFWGALVATLPISAGPIYVLLAIDHDKAFVLDAVAGTLAALFSTAGFLICLAKLTHRIGLIASLAVALGFWAVTVYAVDRYVPTDAVVARAFAWSIAAMALGHWMTSPERRIPARLSDGSRWYDVPVRATLVGLLVATVSTFSAVVGPAASGYAAMFPIVMISLSIILRMRLGTEAVSLTMASTFLPLMGFPISLIAVAAAATRFGIWPSLGFGLLAALAWAALLAWLKLRWQRR
ncbi:MAG: hypothetical protein AAGG99_05145, partial [Pseudomonadota bacterium]